MGLKKNIKLFISNRFTEILYPLIPEKIKIKTISKILSSEFLNHEKPISYTLINNIIIKHFYKHYEPKNPSEYYRNIIKTHVWGGRTGMQWHIEEAEYDENLDKYGYWRKIQVLQIESFLMKNIQYKYIIEIGCGNGKYIDYISRKLGNKYQYIGIDLSYNQIEWNKERYKENTSLEFQQGDASSFKDLKQYTGALYLTFGTLSCFTKDELDSWLMSIQSDEGKNAVSIAEWLIEYDYEKEDESIPMSPSLYNHNYAVRVKKAEMEIIENEYISGNSEFVGYIRNILLAETNINHE
jgi:SAM-dependent methyltransferase